MSWHSGKIKRPYYDSISSQSMLETCRIIPGFYTAAAYFEIDRNTAI